jgi:uncharacterized protein (TIGR00725 family)
MRRPRIGVIGSAQCSREIYQLAEQVGEGIGRRGAILICGGLGGVMEAACKGAKRAGGTTVGILPGTKSEDANRYIDIPVATGLSLARNLLVVRSSQALIAIEGRYGTLSEIAFALQLGVPVIGLRTTYTDRQMRRAEDAEDAVHEAFAALAEVHHEAPARGRATTGPTRKARAYADR